MSSVQILNYISQQLNIYWSIFIFIFGLIGNIWNILIFRHYTLRSISTCTYMSIESIASLIYIIFSLLDRIIDKGFDLNLSANSIAWCKIRTYTSQCSSLIALSCLVLSIVDRFFSTCHKIKWRHLNSVSTAKRICLFLTLFWIFVNIPTLIYIKPIEISLNKSLCKNSSIIWSRFVIYFLNLCCYGIFPWFLMCLFGYLLFRNIQQTHNRRIVPMHSLIVTRMGRIDNELTRILFYQIFLCILSSIPYCIYFIYKNLTQTINKNEYRQKQEYLCLQIVDLIYYFNYILTFYINLISSKIYRQISKQVFINLFKKTEDTSRQITMVNHQETQSQLNKYHPKIYTIKHLTPIVSDV